MAGNPNYDVLLSTTIANFNKKLTDNVWTARPLTNWLKSKDRIRMEDGGTKIIEPLIYASNDTVATYSGYDTIALTPQAGITAAEFDWKQLAGSIAINGLEEAQNSGESQILKLLEAKIMQLEQSLQEKFNTMFFSDGTGNSGKDWLGLEAIVDSTGTVGNIPGGTDTWWRSYKEATATALTLALLNTGYNSVSVGNDHPDFEITTQTLFEKYESLLAPNLRYMDTKTADAGFQNLLHKATPVTYDVHCPTGTWYFLNSKYIQLVGHKDRWLQQTPFVRPENMDARYALITCYGNLTVRNRARLGKLTAKTA